MIVIQFALHLFSDLEAQEDRHHMREKPYYKDPETQPLLGAQKDDKEKKVVAGVEQLKANVSNSQKHK